MQLCSRECWGNGSWTCSHLQKRAWDFKHLQIITLVFLPRIWRPVSSVPSSHDPSFLTLDSGQCLPPGSHTLLSIKAACVPWSPPSSTVPSSGLSSQELFSANKKKNTIVNSSFIYNCLQINYNYLETDLQIIFYLSIRTSLRNTNTFRNNCSKNRDSDYSQ